MTRKTYIIHATYLHFFIFQQPILLFRLRATRLDVVVHEVEVLVGNIDLVPNQKDCTICSTSMK